ncbi:hypothetical protein FQN54_007550 [Arachnomyces sp. PD_36]|nr:hypothetical protein FQN54_007550 [Arachnomyces sp. PD_36]
MDNKDASDEQCSLQCPDTNIQDKTHGYTGEVTGSSDKPFLPIYALALAVISAVIGREVISLMLEFIVLAWAIDRLGTFSNDLTQDAANRQAQLEEAWERNLRQLYEVLQNAKREELQEEEVMVVDEAALSVEELPVTGEGEGELEEEEDGGDEEEVVEEESGEELDEDEETDADEMDSAEIMRPELAQHTRIASSGALRQGVSEVGQANYTAASKQTPTTSVTLAAHLPYPLLERDPCATCVGETQKGDRCRNSFISGSSRNQATKRIELMKSENPGNSFEWEPLKELADWMLCPRWHRDEIPQGRDIANRWYAELASARAVLLRLSTNQNNASSFQPSNTETPMLLGSPDSVSSSPGRSIFTPTRSPLSRSETPQSSAPSSTSRVDIDFYPRAESFNRVKCDRMGNPVRNLAPTFAALREVK